MPIAVKKMNGWSAMMQLGFPEDKIGEMVGLGIECQLTASGFLFYPPHEPGGKHYAITTQLNDLIALKGGKLSAAKQTSLLTELMLAYTSLVEKATKNIADNKKMTKLSEAMSTAFGAQLIEPSGNHIQFAVSEGKSMAGALELLKATAKITPKPKTVIPNVGMAVNAPWSEFPEHMKKSAPLIPLRQATQMYQPVQGTSAGSRYYVVAANADLRVAARFQSGTLSVRIEGKGWDKYKAAIVASGFGKVSPNKQYASLHLEVGHDKVMASKTLGAVLLGLGIPMETPLPDLNKVPKN